MITLITGQTGSGKTFLSVKLLYKAWKKGFNIYTNHPLNFGSDEGIIRWHQLDELFHVQNGIIFIDDAKKLLDAQRWQQLPPGFKDKISGHRHDHLDIITNIQDYFQINVDVRRNVHQLINTRSVFRSSRNDRKLPLLQITKAIYRKRFEDMATERSRWVKVGRPHFYFISRIFSKKLYETYDNIYLNRFVCKILYQKKPNAKRGKWFGKIYSRDLVNQGRARI